jgi:hypothetical protein
MAQSTLDLIFRTKKTGTGGAEAEKEMSGVEKATKRFGDAAKVAAVVGVGLLVGGLTASIAAAIESQKVMAQTEAVIKATGGAAGLTAQEISNLAGAESRLTSIDDEVIQSGANMLLTFKEIGGETFPRATRAMEDMSVAMAGGDTSAIDLTGTAIQLGKALNDPLKGLTALSKAGVTFSASQKAAIKEMVAMNDIAGAQAVILSELESEFGGAAEAAGSTTAGAMAKLSNEVGNALEAIGEGLLPAVRDLVVGLTNLVTWGKLARDTLREGASGALESATSYEGYRAALELVIEEKKKELGWSNLSIDANGNLIRTVEGLFGAESGIIESHFALNEAQFKSIQIGKEWSGVLDRAADMGRQLADVQEVELIPSEEELEQAAKDAAKAAEEQAKALDNARNSAAGAAEGFFGLAQAYADGMTTMDSVKRALDAIDEAQRNGIITDAERRTAQEQIMLQYGLTTEAGLIMASAEEELNRLLNAGFISATDYTGALLLIPAAAKDGHVSMSELGEGARFAAQKMGDAEQRAEQLRDRIAQLESKEITVTTIFQTVGHEEGVGGPGGRQFGGPVFAGEPVRVHPPELFFPQQSGFIMSQADTRELLGLLRSLVTRPGVINFNTTAPLNATRDSATIRALAGAF